MTAQVRLFTFDGIDQMPVGSTNGQYAANGVFMLRVPPLARSGLLTLSGTAQNSSADLSASPNTKILRIESNAGSVVGYEISPPGRNNGVPVAADNGSMRFSGSIEIPFGKGYVVSLIDMTT